MTYCMHPLDKLDSLRWCCFLYLLSFSRSRKHRFFLHQVGSHERWLFCCQLKSWIGEILGQQFLRQKVSIVTVHCNDFLADHWNIDLSSFKKVNASNFLQPIAHSLANYWGLAILRRKNMKENFNFHPSSFSRLIEKKNFPTSIPPTATDKTSDNSASINHNLCPARSAQIIKCFLKV